ncbi:MAG: hypothetical protein D6B27_04690 [Gammaproteobacteria bacterium]|nr:MAG: hypothetical protein D6B27_04690 [Gammaproteobacteria bacterium]
MKFRNFIIMLFAAFALISCGVQPIKSMSNRQVTSLGDKNVTKEMVKKAIMRAAIHKGWTIKETSDNTLRGTLNLRKHTAIIDITYSEKAYSIKYVDSANLNYDSKTHTIHRQYNNWVIYLDRSIQVYIGEMQ